MFRLLPNWLESRAEEKARDGEPLSDYTLLYREYQKFLDQGFSFSGAGQKTYDIMNASHRFDLCNYARSPKYITSFTYHNDYNIFLPQFWEVFEQSYEFYPQNFAAHPRVGYSVRTYNEDGTILAIGFPTDSMNKWDDANVWYRNRRECDEEKNYAGQQGGGYQSPFDSEARYKILVCLDPLVQARVLEPSYVNAGAVQVFNSRKYYP